MKHSYLLILMVVIFIPACSDDPKLVEKREKQKQEITRLRGELELIDEKLKNMPPDVSVELARLKAKADADQEEIEKLQGEVSLLEKKKVSLQGELDAYRSKYPLK